MWARIVSTDPNMAKAMRPMFREVAIGRTEEERMIREVTQTITRHDGRAPEGWMGPGLSETAVTPDLLKEAGYDVEAYLWVGLFTNAATPEPVLAILRKAIADTMNDKDFIAESVQRNGLPFDYVDEKEAAKVFKALSGASPEIISALKESMDAMGAK